MVWLNLFWKVAGAASIYKLSFSKDVYCNKVVREISAAEKCGGWEKKCL